MKIIILAVAASAAALAAALSPGTSPAPIPNRLIDYTGFRIIVETSQTERENHRLTEDAFRAAMAEPGVVILDARSANMYQRQHIKGSVSLPFTDFTARTLALAVPSKDTKILIYCNNNFLNSPIAFESKNLYASLNLSTYTSLRSYGYKNIYELGPLLKADVTKIPFEGTAINASR